MDKKRKDEIVGVFRGDFCSSSFIPWVVTEDFNENETLSRTSIYFLDWFNDISSIINISPYGGSSIDCNWRFKYKEIDEMYASVFRLTSKSLLQKDNSVITSRKLFKDPSEMSKFTNKLSIVKWGLITYSNLLLAFISHRNYTTGLHKLPLRFHDELTARAKYDIKQLLDMSLDTQNESSLSEHFSEDISEIASYTSIRSKI